MALGSVDMRTGGRKWVSQLRKGDNSIVNCGGRVTGNCPNPEGPNLDFGSSPILRTLKNRKPVIVVGNESGIVYAFDAANRGKQLWQHEVGLPPGEGSLLGGQAADEDTCLLYTSDAADERSSVDLGGRRILKKKKNS